MIETWLTKIVEKPGSYGNVRFQRMLKFSLQIRIHNEELKQRTGIGKSVSTEVRQNQLRGVHMFSERQVQGCLR